METNPRVFISYCHESEDHANRVLTLAGRLRAEGVDCRLDAYESSPPEGWPRWMEEQIASAAYVLMICTPTYKRRVMGMEESGKGLGVRWEGNLIYQHLYSAGTVNKKFVPVLLAGFTPEDVPLPLQGATYYQIDIESEYNKLYWRLRGMNQTTKPELGPLRPLPEIEAKTDVGMFLTGFVDVELWNKAMWTGCLFMHDREHREPPTIGFLYKDREAAEKIFLQWRRRLGLLDEFNELRLSIVEGAIEGEPDGYSVHVSANIENIIKRMDHEGIDVPRDYIMVISRIHRMNPETSSKNLSVFKKRFAEFHSYYLVPAYLREDGIAVMQKLSIHKREIELRMARDIRSKHDLDSVLIPEFRREFDNSSGQ